MLFTPRVQLPAHIDAGDLAMLAIVLDLLVLVTTKMALEQDDSPDWPQLAIAVVVIAVINTLLVLFLAPAIGMLVFVPMLIAAVPVLMLLCQMTPRNAAIAAAAMVAARLLLMWLF